MTTAADRRVLKNLLGADQVEEEQRISKKPLVAGNLASRCGHLLVVGRRRLRMVGLSARRDSEFTEYVQARLTWLRRLAYLLCQDWNGADDLVQAAMTRLYVHWGQARSADQIDGYVRAILVRECLSVRRSAWARRVVLAVPVPEAAGLTSDRDAALDLRGALARLPPRQRATLVLRFYCDLSVDQAAQVLGCSVGTVKSQTAKGLGALRLMLGPAGAGPQGRSPVPLSGHPAQLEKESGHG